MTKIGHNRIISTRCSSLIFKDSPLGFDKFSEPDFTTTYILYSFKFHEFDKPILITN